MRKKIVKVKTLFGTFECIFELNKPEKGYTVTVPRVRGVVTCGDTLAEAKKMAKEAIELHCECLVEEGLAELKIYRKHIRSGAHAVA
jgi:predicted RNase H-like HicB family nuclease